MPTVSDQRDWHLPGSAENRITRDERDEMYTLVFRRWPPFLTGAEFAIVANIYDRTISYNKRWEYVSIGTLENGIVLKEYRQAIADLNAGGKYAYRRLTAKERAFFDSGKFWLSPPTGLSRKWIILSLNSLIDRQFVLRGGTKQAPELALNPDCHVDYMQWFFPGRARRFK